jgi:hypothetical protein
MNKKREGHVAWEIDADRMVKGALQRHRKNWKMV